MYDDQHVYSKPGEGWAHSTEEKKALAKEKAAAMAGAPANADAEGAPAEEVDSLAQ